MSKKVLSAQLTELCKKLGREPDLTGTEADIQQRLLEAQEELDTLDENEDGSELPATGDSPLDSAGAEIQNGSQDTPEPLVTVKMLKTCHLHALHDITRESIPIALAGTVVRIHRNQLKDMVESGLVLEI